MPPFQIICTIYLCVSLLRLYVCVWIFCYNLWVCLLAYLSLKSFCHCFTDSCPCFFFLFLPWLGYLKIFYVQIEHLAPFKGMKIKLKTTKNIFTWTLDPDFLERKCYRGEEIYPTQIVASVIFTCSQARRSGSDHQKPVFGSEYISRKIGFGSYHPKKLNPDSSFEETNRIRPHKVHT